MRRCSSVATKWKRPGKSSIRSARRGQASRSPPRNSIPPEPGDRWRRTNCWPSVATLGAIRSRSPDRRAPNPAALTRDAAKLTPMDNFELISFHDADALAKTVADRFLTEVAGKTATPYCVALSGGRIGGRLLAFAAVQSEPKALSSA